MVAQASAPNGSGALIVSDKVAASQSHRAIGVTVPSTTKAIGIIQPPPDIRSKCDPLCTRSAKCSSVTMAYWVR